MEAMEESLPWRWGRPTGRMSTGCYPQTRLAGLQSSSDHRRMLVASFQLLSLSPFAASRSSENARTYFRLRDGWRSSRVHLRWHRRSLHSSNGVMCNHDSINVRYCSRNSGSFCRSANKTKKKLLKVYITGFFFFGIK